ncbi:MAG: 4-alpha-glucanotransferase [Kofleriaceae bacterium]
MTAIGPTLERLGVRRMLLAIHDASFPSERREDLGRGSPASHGADRLFGYASSLGFTGIQLGPQGQTSHDNLSPYDGTIFSRNLATIALRSFREGGPYAGLVSEAALDAAVVGSGPPQHAHAQSAIRAIVGEAYANAPAALRGRLGRFRRDHAAWLERDGLYAALFAARGTSFRHWPEADAQLWQPGNEIRRAQLLELHAETIERYAFGQMLAHEEHGRVRNAAARHRLALYGDLQVGYSDGDAWAYAPTFLRGYAMGAPPSRTNPEGQPWSYPVLDPDQYAGAARALVVARLDKAFAEYDSVRIDHPHGLVCPWVYRTGTGDELAAVQQGARLFESPDLPDHPELMRFAIATAEQLDRSQPRYADHWVRALTQPQIDRYAVLFDAMIDCATRHRRSTADISCEVLSTLPRPLGYMLARFGLGRWRVTQKANLADATDVYRTENAQPEDWVMIGNHDTPPIFALIRGFTPAVREQWARHLGARLALRHPSRLASPGFLATAMLAELFASRAENVSIFFADLFGYEDRFNAPGTYNDVNWTLRLPEAFEQLHRERLAKGEAIDIALAAELALAARATA